MAKIIGAILGWFLFYAIHWILAPIGLLIGLVVGAIAGRFLELSSFSSQKKYTAEERKAIEQAFFNALFPLMGHIAKADGRICEAEIKNTELLFEKMGLDEQGRKKAVALFKSGADDNFDCKQTVATFLDIPDINANLKNIFIVYLISLAYADGSLHEEEDKILRFVAQQLGYSVFAYQHLLGMIEAQRHFYREQEGAYHYGEKPGAWRKTNKDELLLAYEALGLTPTATDKEVKTAWRKLMSEFHPDKLSGRGVPEDMVKLATERSQEIQLAYDLIKKSRRQ